ncbi:MAG: T9SS type A sorting domain-containing protein [Bacteroidales bacterium]|nr:T9SS type A sorting domain-containing protein [Bacteroidales bacterium]MCF8337986.1 T9SS type A sorting domain-containing protein [Bacteroidales bacterium]
MYIKILILISFFYSINEIIAQQAFNTTITEPKRQVIHDIKEDANSDFILVGRNENTDSEMYRGYVIKINTYGEMINDTIVNSEGVASIFFNVFSRNESYVVLGSIYDTTTSTNNQKLWFLKLDHDLNILETKILDLPEEKWISYTNAIIDSDGNYVLTGYTGEEVDNQTVTDPFYYKLSPSGDSITSSFPQEENFLARTYDIMEKSGHTGYYAFSSYLDEEENYGSMVALSNNFEVEEIMSIPMFSFNYYSPIRYGNSIIINTNGENDTSGEADLNVMKIDTNANLIDNRWVGKQGDTADYPSYTRGTSRVGLNAFYASGTANISESNPFYGNGIPNWILLGKYTSNLEEQWLKYYGGDAYYHVYSMTTTSDHGCAVVASRFDYENPETDRDIYVMKVNGDGIITWDQAIKPNNKAVTIYPNPGSHSIHIDTDTRSYTFRLYDAMGQQVLQTRNQKTIDVSRLEAGIYFYRVATAGKILTSGKWVKN